MHRTHRVSDGSVALQQAIREDCAARHHHNGSHDQADGADRNLDTQTLFIFLETPLYVSQ